MGVGPVGRRRDPNAEPCALWYEKVGETGEALGGGWAGMATRQGDTWGEWWPESQVSRVFPGGQREQPCPGKCRMNTGH